MGGCYQKLRNLSRTHTSHYGAVHRATVIQKVNEVCELRQRIAFITNDIIRTWRSRVDTDLSRCSCCVHNPVKFVNYLKNNFKISSELVLFGACGYYCNNSFFVVVAEVCGLRMKFEF